MVEEEKNMAEEQEAELNQDQAAEASEDIKAELDEEVSETDQQFAELEEELAKEKEEKEKYIDRLQRLQAEFSNYRKRVIKEKSNLAEQATKDFIVELLPIIDNFERALASSLNDEGDGVLKGVEMIYRQLNNLLTKTGVEAIVTVGEEFDPNLHNAVMKEESEDYESGVIIEELQKGYIFNESVIRPAMVKVSE
ncbi:molecular chaperone GrpE [Orenia metallireducens]|jgi:molecular chaperone GrpE|uniref:Protein GrpE n=1 Tax=Orenia metallireducens TaxID=1413210 RepID=A0A285G8M3_9FIRM|nr:nucleotide exchange factor GrpE [Orenia metallireducens]PRX28351.1 molecular chaperone GrpE [Orenia metallireducens]SNY18771.1 molecular chaperone GrpE [Orenia metallireducens]